MAFIPSLASAVHDVVIFVCLCVFYRWKTEDEKVGYQYYPLPSHRSLLVDVIYGRPPLLKVSAVKLCFKHDDAVQDTISQAHSKLVRIQHCALEALHVTSTTGHKHC